MRKSKTRPGNGDQVTTVLGEIHHLSQMTVAGLREKHVELYGTETKSRHKQSLFEKLAGRVQELAYDEKSQRAAWGPVGEDWPIMETGIYNLTENESGALLHFDDGETQEWTMVRLDDPDKDAAAESDGN